MIVIFGGSGYIGNKLCRGLQARGREVRVISRQTCNYLSEKEVGSAIHGSQFVINAAGYTGRPNVDACENHKEECLYANSVLPGIVRRACERRSLPWIHVSSGCIYQGTRSDGKGFHEKDLPNFCFRRGNCSFYSGTKALGEEVLQGAPRCYQLRLRLPFEAMDGPRNYLSKLLRYERLLEATNSLSFVDDFVLSCLHCVDSRPPTGVYNVVNPGRVTTKEVTGLIQEHGVSSKQFQFFDSEDEFMSKAAIAPRSNCVLDSSKAIRAGFPLRPVRQALSEALTNWMPSVD